MLFKNGYIYHFQPCDVAYPAKNKFVICISKSKSKFYLVNSFENNDGTPNGRPHSYEKDFAFKFQKKRINCLKHGSYININRLEFISNDSIVKSKIDEKESIPQDIWLSLKQFVRDFDSDKPRCRISQETKDIMANITKDK